MILGLIGSAGRGDTYAKLDVGVWNKTIKKLVLDFVLEHKISHIVSGAAAFADHLSVQLFLSKKVLSVDKLTLHFPCEFDLTDNKFNEDTKTGQTANYYHKRFNEKMKPYVSSYSEISEALSRDECNFTVTPEGFLARNTLVANDCEMILALTFGKENVVADGGTSDTMRKFIKKNGNAAAYHLDLNTNKIYGKACA